MMAVWSTWLCFVFALFVSIQASKYKIKVYTGNKYYAGTSAQVSITLHAEQGSCGSKKLTPPNHWWTNTVNEFTIDCPTLRGYVKSVKIGHDNTGSSAGWYLEKVIVVDLESRMFFEFPCSAWIASGYGLSKTLHGHRYRIEVRTGDRVHSGTDASVYITLYGQSAHCGERQLDDSSNNFERYRTDTFTLTCPELGEVKKVFIRHDNRGASAGWYLKKIVVYDTILGTAYVFNCNSWLYNGHGYDGISRTLYKA